MKNRAHGIFFVTLLQLLSEDGGGDVGVVRRRLVVVSSVKEGCVFGALWGDANHIIFVTSWQVLVKSMATDGVSTVCTTVHNYRAHNITLKETLQGKQVQYLPNTYRGRMFRTIFRRILNGGGQ